MAALSFPRLTALSAVLLAACQHGAPAGRPDTGLAALDAARCGSPALPGLDALPEAAKLPDPFTFADGRKVATRADWACRRAELSSQVQHYELGPKPAAEPVSAQVAETADGKEITVSVTRAGRTVSFPVRIRLPAGGKPPYPAIIGMGMISLNNDELSRMGIALVTFPNNLVAEQKDGSSRGKGKFYELYGADHPAGAMSAWAWGMSRLVDALEATPAARLDATRLGVTGCSRNGKGAIVAGALDERIRLVLAQESGNGGASGWRVADAQRAGGQNVQTLRQIVTENVWFTEAFRQFGPAATRLPFDQHEVMGLIAPRGLLVIENTSMEWLGNQSAWITSLAARETWKALGAPDAMGISQAGGHPHCQLPASQYGYVNSFARKFLLGDGAADTSVVQTDGSFARELGPWVEWNTPALR
jgi:hypothetical protein